MENQELKLQDPTEELKALALELIKAKSMVDLMKPIYEKIDNLTLQIKDKLGENGYITVEVPEEDRMILHNGEANFLEPIKTIYIVDNFAERNTVFRPAGVKRFEATFENPVKEKKTKKVDKK